MAQYTVGQVVRLGVTFVLASSGLAADPTVVTFHYRTPGGVTVDEIYAAAAPPAPQKSGTGVYFRDLTLDEIGTYDYRWDGSGAVTTAAEDSLAVKASMFG